MLYRLVLSDWTTKNNSLSSVACGPINRVSSNADRLGRDQDTFRVKPVKQIAKALTLLTNSILNRNNKVINKQLVLINRFATHLVNLTHANSISIKSSIEEG